MAKHKLILEDVFEEIAYSLIAIHCSLEDYRLSYLLNKNLFINLAKKEDLDYDAISTSYSIFEWKDMNHQTIWNLVSNVCRKESETSAKRGSLFGDDRAIKTHNLVPEYKNVDYFLKISNEEWFSNEKTILHTIQGISHIVTAYAIDATQLKSRNNLIFN